MRGPVWLPNLAYDLSWKLIFRPLSFWRNLATTRVMFEQTGCHVWESCMKKQPFMYESHGCKDNLSCLRVLYKKTTCQVWVVLEKTSCHVWESCLKRQPILHEKTTGHVWKDNLSCMRVMYEKSVCQVVESCIAPVVWSFSSTTAQLYATHRKRE